MTLLHEKKSNKTGRVGPLVSEAKGYTVCDGDPVAYSSSSSSRVATLPVICSAVVWCIKLLENAWQALQCVAHLPSLAVNSNMSGTAETGI